MKKLFSYILVILLGCACSNAPNLNSKELVVYCASSLTDVVSELSEQYEKEHALDIQLNFASSGTLARQIEHGAQPSIFISANEKWVDYLIRQNILIPETKQRVAKNSLALIVPLNSAVDSIPFTSDWPARINERLAIGDPKHVPAGEYAWQAIEKMAYAEKLKGRILPTKDVRSALMLVELGEVEMGIVYKSDALKSEKVKIVAEILEEMHTPIVLFSSILIGNRDKETQLFYNFLTSKKAKGVWKKYGFIIE